MIRSIEAHLRLDCFYLKLFSEEEDWRQKWGAQDSNLAASRFYRQMKIYRGHSGITASPAKHFVALLFNYCKICNMIFFNYCKIFNLIFFNCVNVHYSVFICGPISASLSILSSFSKYNWIWNKQSVDVVLGIWTCGCRIVGADGSTELWRPSFTQCWRFTCDAARSNWWFSFL